MKKFLTLFITLISVLSAALLPNNFTGAFADNVDTDAPLAVSEESVSTDIFLPTSYLQYYKLDNPYAICRYEENGERFVAISHAGAIVIYKYDGETGKEQFRSVPISGSPSIGVSSIAKYKNFLLFTQWSNICYIDVSNFDSVNSVLQVKTGYPCSNSFSVFGDSIAVTTTEGIVYYDLSITNEKLEFTEKTEKNYNYETNNPSSVLYSANENTYFYSADAKAVIEYSPENGTERKIATEIENVKSIAESGNKTDNNIYFSCSDGIFFINPEKDSSLTTLLNVSSVGEKDLGKLWNPKGICVLDDKLWVVDADNTDKDNSINAIQEIDLKSGEFTDFAITTNSKAINRLSDKAQDIFLSGNKIYALDDSRIVVINNCEAPSEQRTYNMINLDSTVDDFAVCGDFIAYSVFNSYNSSSEITVAKITNGTDENDPILTLEKIDVYNSLLESIRIRDIACMDDVFYFFGTQINHPILYSFDVKSSESNLKILSKFGNIAGNAELIAADPFNTLYFAVSKSGGYELHKFESGKSALLCDVATDKKLLSLQTDLDGKVYLLYENNLVECFDDGKKLLSKTLATSDNLGTISPAVAMCLSCDSRYAYFIFSGLILRSSDETELNISTPYTINIPSDFSFSFTETEVYGKIREGAKLFEIKASELSSEFFRFEKFAIENGKDDYAIKDLGGKYYLILKDERAAIVRKTDFLTESSFSLNTSQKTAFAITDFEIYGLPILKKLYREGVKINKFDKVDVIGELTFNGDEYYAVSTESACGLIPKTFVKEYYLSESEYNSIQNVYVYQKGGTAVYADDFETKTDEISSYKKVVLLSVVGDYAQISYDGKIGFVKTNAVINDSRKNILKAIAVVLLALSSFVTVYYFEKKYLFKKS